MATVKFDTDNAHSLINAGIAKYFDPKAKFSEKKLTAKEAEAIDLYDAWEKEVTKPRVKGAPAPGANKDFTAIPLTLMIADGRMVKKDSWQEGYVVPLRKYVAHFMNDPSADDAGVQWKEFFEGGMDFLRKYIDSNKEILAKLK